MVRDFYAARAPRAGGPQLPLPQLPQLPQAQLPVLPIPPPGNYIYVVVAPRHNQPQPVLMPDGAICLLPVDPKWGPRVVLLAAPIFTVE